MTNNEMICELTEYSHDNYDKGGHWIFECYITSDYQDVLTECGSLDKAKEKLKAIWELREELSTNCGDY
jgi:hypothetical protein